MAVKAIDFVRSLKGSTEGSNIDAVEAKIDLALANLQTRTIHMPFQFFASECRPLDAVFVVVDEMVPAMEYSDLAARYIGAGWHSMSIQVHSVGRLEAKKYSVKLVPRSVVGVI